MSGVGPTFRLPSLFKAHSPDGHGWLRLSFVELSFMQVMLGFYSSFVRSANISDLTGLSDTEGDLAQIRAVMPWTAVLSLIPQLAHAL